MEWSHLWSAIGDSNSNHNIKWVSFSIFNNDVKVAALREYACVDQLIFRFLTTAIVICSDKICIWKSSLWVLVQSFHIRMSRRIVKKEIILFHILPMIAFSIRQAKESLFQNWIGLVP